MRPDPSPLAKSPLTPAQVCAIIKACRDAQVTELQLGDLYVRFGPQAKPGDQMEAPAAIPANVAQAAPTPQKKPGPESPEAHEEATKALVQEELNFREEQLALMWIEDPLAAQELILKGELEIDGD
jgi:hypothetical protein